MSENKKLSEIIATLQRSVTASGLNKAEVITAINELAVIGYKYQHETFPKLVKTENFADDSSETPQGLAEALLWKLGKWKSYKKFVTQYVDENSKPSNGDVVFFAFAKHLRNTDKPIYDQHAIRAMWAICGNLTAEEKELCKRLLMKKNDGWKDAGSGKGAVDCYNIFLKYLGIMERNGASKRELDLLLMPLGQAIKKQTKNYKDFCILCGW